jgi:hypothetical protein
MQAQMTFDKIEREILEENAGFPQRKSPRRKSFHFRFGHPPSTGGGFFAS